MWRRPQPSVQTINDVFEHSSSNIDVIRPESNNNSNYLYSEINLGSARTENENTRCDCFATNFGNCRKC